MLRTGLPLCGTGGGVGIWIYKKANTGDEWGLLPAARIWNPSTLLRAVTGLPADTVKEWREKKKA
ncbi:hypothetical protein [Arthrobacter sp. HLT1-21]